MDNEQIFLNANQALGAGHYEEFITYCAEDITWENVGKNTFNGKAELLNYISSAYEGMTFTTEISVKEDDIIVELGQIVLGNGGNPSSSYCDVWKFQDGLIKQVRSFVINNAMQQ